MADQVARRVAEAQQALADLGFDAERQNERSALVLLALLDLSPGRDWVDAENPRVRTVEIMDWLRHSYAKDYKPNTRETIRRQTLHQFADAGLVAINPDDRTRPVNSPKTCYQVEPSALGVLRGFDTDAYRDALAAYLGRLPGLVAKYAREREQDLLAVTLPDGRPVRLTPGGQNELLKLMLEGFCPRWTPGGQVLYVGDAGKDDPVFEKAVLGDLGIGLDKHGKFPDLIVYLPERNWLVLMEAASSHGPVDAKRYSELLVLFGGSSAGVKGQQDSPLVAR